MLNELAGLENAFILQGVSLLLIRNVLVDGNVKNDLDRAGKCPFAPAVALPGNFQGHFFAGNF